MAIILGVGFLSMSFTTNSTAKNNAKIEVGVGDDYKQVYSNISYCDPDGQTCGMCDIYEKDGIYYARVNNAYRQIQRNYSDTNTEFLYRFHNGTHWCYISF